MFCYGNIIETVIMYNHEENSRIFLFILKGHFANYELLFRFFAKYVTICVSVAQLL